MGKENMNLILSQVPRMSYLYSTAENSKVNSDMVEKKVKKIERDKKPKKVVKSSKLESIAIDLKERGNNDAKRKIDLFT